MNMLLQLLEDATRHSWFPIRFGRDTVTYSSIPVDISKPEDAYTIELPMPGIEPESLKLTTENGVLTVKGEPDTSSPDKKNVVLQERPRRALSRSFQLPAEIDVEKIAATYKHGILTINLPVGEMAKPRRIEITTH